MISDVPAPEPKTFISQCPVCQASIDVTDLEPFTKVACPSCGQLVRVRRNFDHFRIIRQIGEGGMSRVFEAEDEALGRRVALKILNKQFSQDATRVEQFKREAQVTARLSHLNVIRLYSTGEDHGYFYLAMELVGGGSLDQRITVQERLSEREVLRIGLEVAEGLRAAQKGGMIHRDVKPANILFTDGGTAKVVDFGLAIFADTVGVHEEGEIWATPYYVAPEKVIEHREDYRSDIYSLGATIYHALTGKPPHRANTNQLSELKRIKAKPVRLEESGVPISPRTVAVVDRMLEVDPAARQKDYDEVVEDLRVAERLITRQPFLPGSRRQKMIAFSVSAVAVAFMLGWWVRSTGERAATSISRVPGVEVDLGAGEGLTVGNGNKTAGERFTLARAELISGNAERALGGFESLVREKVRQPTQSWALLHGAVCAVMLEKREVAERMFGELAKTGTVPLSSEKAESTFFADLGKKLEARKKVPLDANQLGFSRTSEEVIGYLLLGLTEWHLGDPGRGMELIQTFVDCLPGLKATSDSASGVRAWLVPYAESFARRYGPDLVIAESIFRFESSDNDLPGIRAGISLLEELRSKLRTGGGVSLLADNKLQALRQKEARMRMADQEAERAAQKARRQRELGQLTELAELLPAFIQGYDYERALELLQQVQFETPEVLGALEGKIYLYQKAQEFVEQLGRDIAIKSWSGRMQRIDGSMLEGTVTTLDVKGVTISLDRGSLEIALSAISPETLIQMAGDFSALVRDSTDYYRRMEMMAVFARVNGLQTMSATIAAPLMEENREFRMRWLKVL